MVIIKFFKDLNKDSVKEAGGKGASLGEMYSSDISVPNGFVILSSAFDIFIKENNLNVKINLILNKVNIKKVQTIDNASKEIQNLILSKEISKKLSKDILSYFKKLKTKFVAVRSSATSEDSASVAWAGQLDTYLNTTEKNILFNVKRCWGSLFTSRAIFYRFEKNLQNKYISVAVVIQKMVNSEKSGIAFSVHPVTEDYNQLIIEAGYGLGEAIVSGAITPDSYIVSKKPLKILEQNISEQSKAMYRCLKKGTKWKELTKKLGGSQVLSKSQILSLSNLIKKIENHYGFPVDIEWAIEKNKIYITQSRPITTLTESKFIYKKDNISEIFIKQHSREYSLFRVYSLYENYEKLSEKIFGYKVKDACKIYRGNLVNVYYTKSSWDGLFKSIAKKVTDKTFFEKLIKKLYNDFNYLLPYFKEKKHILKKNELKKVYEKYTEYYLLHGMVFAVPRMDFLPQNIKDIALKARKDIQDYNETIEDVFKETLVKFYPFLKDKTKFVLPEEVWSEEVKNKKNMLQKIKERNKGFVFYRGEIFTGNIEGILDNLGIRIEEKTIKKQDKLKGQSAFNGKVKGKVKIVLNIKDLNKIKKGDILVTAMTMPNYLPAMYKAAAFVTDEGGITCHAAIVSRELKKPCVIGTKIATDILKDGDLVEVDADNGVVRILNKEKNKIDITQSRSITKLKKTTTINKVNTLLKIKNLSLLFSRELNEFTLFRLSAAQDSMTNGFYSIVGEKMNHTCAVYDNKNLVKIYYDLSELQNITQKIIELSIKDPKLVIQKISANLNKFKQLYIRFKKNTSKIKNLDELKEIQNLCSDNWMYMQLVTVLPTLPVSEKLKQFALKKRAESQEYNFVIQKAISLFIESKYSYLKNKSNFVLPDDIWSGLVNNKIELLKLITKREKGYVYYQGNLYTGDIFKNLNKLNITLSGQEFFDDKYKTQLHKEHSREYSLTRIYAWYLSYLYYFKKIKLIKKDLKNTTFIYTGKDLVDVYYDNKELFTVFKIIESNINSNPKLVYLIFSNLLKKFNLLLPYFKGRQIKSIFEYQKIIKLYGAYWAEVAVIFVLPEDNFNVSKKIKLKALALREKIQKYAESLEPIFKEFIENKFPYLKNNTKFVFPDDIISKTVNNKKLMLNIIKERKKGFVYYQGKLYTDNISDTLDKLNLTLEKQKLDIKEIGGQIAYKGKVQGIVRIITSQKQIGNFKKGEIMVAAMTMPNYLPAMKKASAFVTDEGGITCHAAIVSRELKKPCVIGTKTATKVLKDGDLIEVDANKGIVKIIKLN